MEAHKASWKEEPRKHPYKQEPVPSPSPPFIQVSLTAGQETSLQTTPKELHHV